MTTALGFCSTLGVIVSLVGAWRLYRFPPYMGLSDGFLDSSEQLPELALMRRRHQIAWGLILAGFLLQLIGSLGWVREL